MFKWIKKWDWKYIIKWAIVIALLTAWGLWMSYNIGAQL